MSTESQLIVFVKAARLGTVKTRLAAGLGPGGDATALEVHRRLAEHAIREARLVAGATTHLVVATTPDDAVDEVRAWLGDDLDVVLQRGEDLGERMASAMKEAFDSGAPHVAIIGTDAPRLRAALIRDAFARLVDVDLVLGPASDGGYWLIAARARVPPVFAGVAWSTPAVLETTEALAARANLTFDRLETLDDVDSADDLARYPELLE